MTVGELKKKLEGVKDETIVQANFELRLLGTIEIENTHIQGEVQHRAEEIDFEIDSIDQLGEDEPVVLMLIAM